MQASVAPVVLGLTQPLVSVFCNECFDVVEVAIVAVASAEEELVQLVLGRCREGSAGHDVHKSLDGYVGRI